MAGQLVILRHAASPSLGPGVPQLSTARPSQNSLGTPGDVLARAQLDQLKSVLRLQLGQSQDLGDVQVKVRQDKGLLLTSCSCCLSDTGMVK